MPYIEKDFPIERVDEIAQREANARKPVYLIHKWWARRVGSTFRAMILATFLNDDPMKHFYKKVGLKSVEGRTPVILDPFMGGGTTVIEGIRLGSKVIGVEINPVAWFVTKKEVEPVVVSRVDKEFKKLEKDIGTKIKFYYRTKCQEGHSAEVMYVFWVKKIRCENCSEMVPLYNSFIIATPKGKEATVFCPKCLEIFVGDPNEESKCPHCGFGFEPSTGFAKGKHYECPHCGYTGDTLKAVQTEGRLPETDMFAMEYYCPICKKRGYKKVDDFDKELFAKAKRKFEENKKELLGRLIPDQEVPDGFNTQQVKNFGYKHFYELFNERQLLCLSMLLNFILDIEDKLVQEFFAITFSGCLDTNNMLCRYDYGYQKISPMFERQVYWPRSMPAENNVWGTRYGRGSFVKCFRKGRKALMYIREPYEIMLVRKQGKYGKGPTIRKNIEIPNDKIDGKLAKNFAELVDSNNKNVLLKCQTSENLAFIPPKSIDAVITDPPYFANVMYAELSDFFYVWLRIAFRDIYPEAFEEPIIRKEREILVNKVFGKDEAFFIDGLGRVFKECRRVLKDNGLMTFTFHHKATEAWSAVLKAILESGFNIKAAYPIHSETRSGLRRHMINYDSILVCRKRTESKAKKIPWAIFEAQLLDSIEKDINRLLERHPDLNIEDIFVIGMGHALHIYSENYGGVMKEGEVLGVDKALETIGGTIFDILLRKVLAKAPDVDRISRIHATVFAGLEGVSLDTINKITRHGGIETDIFESEHLLKKAKKNLMKIVSEKERKNHIQRKIERGIPLMYVDAAHLLRTARSERVRLNETLQAIVENGINKEKLAMYLHFLAERTKDVEWKRVEKSLESTEIPTLEKYM